MRLIDEHKATDDICEHITTKALSRVVAILQSQPSVEAIPVEWLEDYQIKEFIKADPSSIEFQRACGIGCAIEAWRKENEMR